MSMETDFLFQKAVLYTASGVDGYADVKLSAGIEISCRWETGKHQSVDANGNTIAVDSVVYVDRVITVGSILWKGKLIDLPSTPTDLKEVVGYEEIPDVKSRKFERSVSVMKHSNELPTLA